MPPRDLDIIIPVYNEGDAILNTLDELARHVTLEARVLIVYDFEGDTTIPALARFAPPPNIELVPSLNTIGRGVCNALKHGFSQVTAPAALVVMGDLSDDLSCAGPMYELFRAGNSVVCASRYVKGGRQIGGPPLKRLMSRMAGVSLHYLTGIQTHDISNNFRLYSKRLLDSVTIESTGGFEVAMELTVKAYVMGMGVAEIPTVWRDRTAGQSRFKIVKWLPKYLKWYFYLLRRRFLGPSKSPSK